VIAAGSNCGNSTSRTVVQMYSEGGLRETARKDLVEVPNRFTTESYSFGVFTVRFRVFDYTQ
jgi:hypothetical protein